ncbi:MAG: hypothetical protein LBQ24_06175 [Candidatus Peribacteria bacterium]|nr:hypothetical protein [Candidatus Peribacteria bacterium]
MIKIDAERGEKFDKIINLKKSREKYHQKLQEARNENKIIGRDVKQ